MAAETELIKEFLVSLGFKIEKAGLESFVKGITAASSAVLASVTAIEDNLERLYFASQRTKASADNIRAFGFALGQMGSSAGAALETIENLARFMRSSPGAAGLIHSLGVQTRDTNGQLRDTTDILKDLGRQFAQMPYYRANAYAQALGIDEKTLIALREGVGDFGDTYRDMLAKIGLDLDDASKKSHEFMVQTRTLASAIAIVGQRISESFSERLTVYIRRFREQLVDNFGRISEIIEKVTKGVLWLADIVSQMALRAIQAVETVVDAWNSLDDGTQKVIAGIAALVVGWKLLNAVFLATPLGRLTALSLALLTLYDDYKTWREGGKSLIDWSIWEEQINNAMFGLGKLGRALRGLGKMAQDAWAGRWSALPADWEEVKAALNAGDVGGGNSQADVDAYKDQGGARLTPDAQRRLSGSGGFEEDGTIVEVPDARAPRGIRNNNPGNLEYRGQAGASLEDHANPRFARFRTAEEGLAALAAQLRRYGQRGIDTVGKVISKYAPSIENDTPGYTGSVSRRLGVDSNTRLDLNDPAILQGLMGAIIQVENGRNPYSAEQIAAASGARAAGVPDRPVSISQSTTIHVAGGTNPEATGQAVAGQQDGVNQRLVRNMRTVAQ
ncbi:hypothetical protein [Caballeronia sp. INDeC2]|uniref:hypothetical protein n=1 Tax=Caballeronia sp. INDeC2 TaxID=2921747 RepID=UPI0020277B10|nr:hypothetical protein [Caballeronia sp. INDeC2]